MKIWKKIVTISLSLVLVLGSVMTTCAAEKKTSSITVEGLSGTATEVRIYKMIGVDENANQWVIADWAKDYVKTGSDGAYTYELSNVKLPEKADGQKTTSDVSVVFDGLELGAYLIAAVDTTGQTVYNNAVATTYQYNEKTHLMENKQARVVAKSSTSKTQKEQSENVGVENDGVVEVGSIIHYSVSTVIPYFDGEDDTFWISDTLTGARYNGDAEVFIGKNVVIAKNNMREDSSKRESETFRYDLSQLLKDNQYAGQTLRLEYTATVIAADEITNVASASNNPDGNVPTTKAYTGEITFKKYGEQKDPLQGAKFVLFREKAGAPEYAVLEKGYLKNWTKDANAATAVTTDENGDAAIKGLNVGTYYLAETVAPEGYTISNPKKVAGTRYAAEVTVEKKEVQGKVLVAGNAVIHDTKLLALPFTGGIGVTVFQLAGVSLILLAIGYFFFRKKHAAKA